MQTGRGKKNAKVEDGSAKKMCANMRMNFRYAYRHDRDQSCVCNWVVCEWVLCVSRCCVCVTVYTVWIDIKLLQGYLLPMCLLRLLWCYVSFQTRLQGAAGNVIVLWHSVISIRDAGSTYLFNFHANFCDGQRLTQEPPRRFSTNISQRFQTCFSFLQSWRNLRLR